MNYSKELAGAYMALRAAEEAQAQNTARVAKSHLFWTTTGTGEFLVEAAMYFDCVFTEKPHFTYGAEVSGNQDLVAKKFPRTHGGVYDWVRARPPGNLAGLPGDNPDDDIMYYTGAYVYFVVDIVGGGVPFTPPQPKYTVTHHLAFEGIAIKNVPVHLFDY